MTEKEQQIVARAKAAMAELVATMNAADAEGIEIGFAGINRTGRKNQWEVTGFFIKKDLQQSA